MKKYNHQFPPITVVDGRDCAEPVEELDISLTYDKGGWTGRRGWSLHVQPLSRVRPAPGVVINRYAPREGVRRFVHPVNRASAKGLRDAIAAAEEALPSLVDFCFGHNPHLSRA